jgi:hypothetical protein
MEMTNQVEELGRVHRNTPNPAIKPTAVSDTFDELEPTLPEEPKIGFVTRLFPWRKHKIEAHYSSALAQALVRQDAWIRRKAHFTGQQARRKQFVERDIYDHVPAMEAFLEEHFHAITWPRETNVAFEIQDAGAKVSLDVDLPEVEHMPTKTATAAARGYRVIIKELTATQVRQLYMDHIHGIGFRIIGETFAALPKCIEVVLSAYSQRPDQGTGHIQNDYLYSVRVLREQWQKLNFNGISSINVVESLARFELRRDMSSKGIFRTIVPLG